RGQRLSPNGPVVADVQADRISLRVNLPGQAQETLWIYLLNSDAKRPRVQRFVSSLPESHFPKGSAGDWVPVAMPSFVPGAPSQLPR
ncbi:MAG: hypothetical protein RJA63_1259, partial [Pseudomonadota bacterium]